MKSTKYFKLYGSMSYTIRSSYNGKIYNCKKDVPVLVDDPIDFQLFSNKSLFQEVSVDGIELSIKVDSSNNKPLSYSRAEQPKVKEVGPIQSIDHLKPYLGREYFEELQMKLGIKEEEPKKTSEEKKVSLKEEKKEEKKVSLKDLIIESEKKTKHETLKDIVVEEIPEPEVVLDDVKDEVKKPRKSRLNAK